jgi:hypothetical protein
MQYILEYKPFKIQQDEWRLLCNKDGERVVWTFYSPKLMIEYTFSKTNNLSPITYRFIALYFLLIREYHVGIGNLQFACINAIDFAKTDRKRLEKDLRIEWEEIGEAILTIKNDFNLNNTNYDLQKEFENIYNQLQSAFFFLINRFTKNLSIESAFLSYDSLIIKLDALMLKLIQYMRNYYLDEMKMTLELNKENPSVLNSSYWIGKTLSYAQQLIFSSEFLKNINSAIYQSLK